MSLRFGAALRLRRWFSDGTRVLVLALALLAVAARASAGEPAVTPRRTAIALVGASGQSALQARLRAELTQLGWRVQEIAPGAELALAQVARRTHTLAALRVGRGGEGIELWVAPEADSEQARSEWIDAAGGRGDLAVLRAVEVLRVRFVEFGLEPERDETSEADAPQPAALDPKPAPEPPPAETKVERRSVASLTPASPGSSQPLTEWPRFWLGLGGGALQSYSDAFVPQPLASLSARYALAKPRPGLTIAALDARVLFPVQARTLEDERGSVAVRTFQGALGVEARWITGRFTSGVGVGAGLSVLNLTASAKPGYAARHVLVFSPFPLLRAATELELTRGLRLRLDLSASRAVPRAAIRFDESEISSFGRPLMGAAVLELLWAPSAN
ncbi:MAG TPA: hypothetical protein VFQ61_39265 [Polyangiaceae bacterium]|nr:hypothetical protein [Polyangiaceae bacterium]